MTVYRRLWYYLHVSAASNDPAEWDRAAAGVHRALEHHGCRSCADNMLVSLRRTAGMRPELRAYLLHCDASARPGYVRPQLDTVLAAYRRARLRDPRPEEPAVEQRGSSTKRCGCRKKMPAVH